MNLPLNLPKAPIKMKDDLIWDKLRKKYLKCTPEEWVRQHFIHYLIDSLHFPEGRMVSEYKVLYNGMNKRCDIAVFNQKMQAQVIIECKAPHIPLTEDTFYQIAKYAHVLKAPVLILTNGINHYCALVSQKERELIYLPEMPTYERLNALIG